MASNSKSTKRKFSNLFSIIFYLSLIITLILYAQWSMNGVPRKICSDSDVGRIRYPRWYRLIARELPERRIRIGTVNMGNETIDNLGMLHGGEAEVVKVRFESVADHIQWSDLFPEWIEENEPLKQKCPEIPIPRFGDYGEVDVVVAKIPCLEGTNKGMGLRDVFRLQVNLVVSNLLVRSSWNDHSMNTNKYVVFMGGTSCGSPMVEIFRCDELLWHDGVWSVYKPDLRRLKQKLLMPVGACQLAPPFAEPGQVEWRRYAVRNSLYQPREAYVTIIHSSETYVCGAIALAQSIKQTNSTKDLVLLADDSISTKSLRGLRAAGWKIKRIERIRSFHAVKDAYNEWNYSKLRIWQLTEYDKVMFIDSDFLVLKSLDDFFLYPELSAVWNDRHLFNSGLMLVEPSNCTFQALMSKRFTVASYNGGDQGFLNEVFVWWHRWPGRLNFLKFFGDAQDFDFERKIPENIHAIHYLGLKPWLCYQDYDCNWDIQVYRKFASDLAHQKWWQIYNSMPKMLRTYCDLTSGMTARIEKWREKAKNADLPDGHWKIKVRDPRRHSLN